MYDNQNRPFVAINDEKELAFVPKMANRHGLITGATGTGKTITLQTLQCDGNSSKWRSGEDSNLRTGYPA